ncbi:hypothetical protein BSN85_12250 [Bradyrhizobium brasilense]|nr:hypothetical protein [Bradyrhizobium brasilense]OMI11586.1 hypothetical protein BSN85_12250 [Bradyrhizobium brasilense]
MDSKRGSSFAGAADLVAHADTARRHLAELSAACANGDKSAARRALRQAISELELARAMLRIGND